MLLYMIEATLLWVFLSPFAPIAWILLVAATASRIGSERPWEAREFAMLLPLLGTLGLILFGAVFAKTDGIGALYSWEQYTIMAVLAGQAALSLFLVWFLKGVRIACCSLMLLELCLSLAAGFEASMSVSNRWL